MPTSMSRQGILAAGRWTKVLWGWGLYSISYRATTNPPGGEYRCYTTPSPFPIASGILPGRVKHSVVGYGDVWFFSPVRASFLLNPVSLEPAYDFVNPPPPPPE